MRVSKWTGETTVCAADQASLITLHNASPILAGVRLICA